MMTYLVLGGAASGKSEYAENLALSLSEPQARMYVATMMPYGESGAYRVKRHRKLREGKGFETVELPRNIGQLSGHEGMTVLVEDLSNLLANEMFAEDALQPLDTNAIARALKSLSEQAKNTVFVSNNIFEDGCLYDESTRSYIQKLGELNRLVAEFCDHVTEVTVGIPIVQK